MTTEGEMYRYLGSLQPRRLYPGDDVKVLLVSGTQAVVSQHGTLYVVDMVGGELDSRVWKRLSGG